jgi:hypothetical protein
VTAGLHVGDAQKKRGHLVGSLAAIAQQRDLSGQDGGEAPDRPLRGYDELVVTAPVGALLAHR